jgi:AcrR family transcriptional regulator
MAQNSKKGEKTRAEILEAAKHLMLKHGYNGTSVRMIAEAAGITPGAIYNHFKGKEELFNALLDKNMPIDNTLRKLATTKINDPEAALKTIISQIVNGLLEHEDYLKLGLIYAQERQANRFRTLPPRIFPMFRAFKTYIEKIQHKNDNLFRDIPVEALLHVLMSMIFGYVLTEFFVDPTETFGLPDIDWVDSMIDVFMYGVMNQSTE